MKIRKIIKNKKGAIGIVTALTLVFLIGVTGTSIDMSRAIITKSKAASALDAGSIAAGVSASRGVQPDAELVRDANRYFDANYRRGDTFTNRGDVAAGNFVISRTATGNKITGRANAIEITKSFGELPGTTDQQFVVNAGNEVSFPSGGALDISFVIDTSCSMTAGFEGGGNSSRIDAARDILPDLVRKIYEENDSSRVHAVAFDYNITTINQLGRGRRNDNNPNSLMTEYRGDGEWSPNNRWNNGTNLPLFSPKANSATMINRMQRLKAPFRGCRTNSFTGLENARVAFANNNRPNATKAMILVYDGAPTMDESHIDRMQNYNNKTRNPDNRIYSCKPGAGFVTSGGSVTGSGGRNPSRVGINVTPNTGKTVADCLNHNDNAYKRRYNKRWEEIHRALMDHQQQCNLVRSAGIRLYTLYIGGGDMNASPYLNEVNDVKFKDDQFDNTFTRYEQFVEDKPAGSRRVTPEAWRDAKDTGDARLLKNRSLHDIVYGCSPNVDNTPAGRRVYTPQTRAELEIALKEIIDSLTKIRLSK